MNEQLIYNIADHFLQIETPSAKTTARLIPSFKPFEAISITNAGDSSNAGDSTKESRRNIPNLLFTFSGNCQVSIPNRAPDDSMEVDGALFKVYHGVDGISISMRVKNSQQQTANNQQQTHCFNISANKRIVTTDLTLVKPYESLFLAYFLRAAFGIASAHHKTIKMHASVIEKGGKALVFLGKSGTGKSTHSRLWREFVPGCQLLNDDEPIVRVMKNGSVRVYGAPWSGSTPCYRNAWAEVTAFVQLYQSSENKLAKLKGLHSFASLLESVATLRSEKENKELVITTIHDILERVPGYRLNNRPDKEAVSLSKTLLNLN